VTSPHSCSMSMIFVKRLLTKDNINRHVPCSKCENKSDQSQLTMGEHICTLAHMGLSKTIPDGSAMVKQVRPIPAHHG
jgi:hypothetical protein